MTAPTELRFERHAVFYSGSQTQRPVRVAIIYNLARAGKVTFEVPADGRSPRWTIPLVGLKPVAEGGPHPPEVVTRAERFVDVIYAEVHFLAETSRPVVRIRLIYLLDLFRDINRTRIASGRQPITFH